MNRTEDERLSGALNHALNRIADLRRENEDLRLNLEAANDEIGSLRQDVEDYQREYDEIVGGK